MKRLTMRKIKKGSLTAILLMSLAPTVLMAQDMLLEESNEALSMSVANEQIDIDGTIKRESVADRMAKQRRLLEKKHEEMVKKKIENMRLREEQKIARQLQKALSGQAMAVDSIGSRQAAPQKVVTMLPVIKKEKVNKVFILGGGKQYSSESLDLEATFNTGLGFETVIKKRFGLGLQFNYTAISVEDRATSGFGNFYNIGYQYNPQIQTQGDRIDITNFSFGLRSKVYITVGTTVQPYVGLGAAYNKMKLSYDKKNTTIYNNSYNNGVNDSVAAGYLSGSIHAGADFNFSDSFGMKLDLGFSKALTRGFDKDSRNINTYQNYDEIILNNIGRQIEQTNIMSVDLGVVVKF